MPTQNRKGVRVQVPLDPETYQVFETYAKALDLPMGRACAQILKETREPVAQLAAAIATAKTAPGKVLDHLLEVTEAQLAQIDQMVMDLPTKEKRKR